MPDGEAPCRTGHEVNFAVHCSSPRDCGGEKCCAFYQTYCAASCINAAVVCEKAVDCPRDYGGIPLVGCQLTTDRQQPPWLKFCVYADPGVDR
jgi:hypothetical protein